jgi:hypothetical protein
MHGAAEYWVNLSIKPKIRMEEQWSTCLKSWEKINKAMIDLQLPNFGSLEDFLGLEEVMSKFQESD